MARKGRSKHVGVARQLRKHRSVRQEVGAMRWQAAWAECMGRGSALCAADEGSASAHRFV